MKHLLFLTQWYPSRITGQSGNFIQRHAQCAAKANKVTVLFAVADAHLAETYEIQMDTQGENLTEIRVFFRLTKNPILRVVRKAKALKLGYQKVGDFDLIHLNITYPIGLFAYYLHRFHGKKYVLTEHWTGFVRTDVSLGFWKRFWMRKIAKSAAYILPVSQHLAESMRVKGLEGNYKVIPNVVDVERFRPSQEKSNKKSNRKTLLHVSSLKEEQKNLCGMRDVLDALNKERQDFEWVIAGLQTQEWFSDFVRELDWKDRIHFHSFASPKQVARLMQKADVFLLLSLYENQPCVIAEAFASGLPVISTDVGGISEFFPKGFGVLLENSPSNWKQQLSAALDSSFAEPREMVRYAQDTFSEKAIGAQLNEVYLSVFEL